MAKSKDRRLDDLENAANKSETGPPHLGAWAVLCVVYDGCDPGNIPPEPANFRENYHLILDEVYGKVQR